VQRVDGTVGFGKESGDGSKKFRAHILEADIILPGPQSTLDGVKIFRYRGGFVGRGGGRARTLIASRVLRALPQFLVIAHRVIRKRLALLLVEG